MSNDDRTPKEMLDDIMRRMRPDRLPKEEINKVRQNTPNADQQETTKQDNTEILEQARKKYRGS
jgi:hypothetical protein